MKIYIPILIVITIILVGSRCTKNDTANHSDGMTEIAYPENYRNWTHVKSVVVMASHSLYDRFGGMHHVYANDKALVALKDSTIFEKGSILIFDLMHEIVADSFLYAGARRSVSVMIKDPDRFPETGGWGFEEFIKDNPKHRSVTDMQKECFSACHKTQIASDFVFSKYRN